MLRGCVEGETRVVTPRIAATFSVLPPWAFVSPRAPWVISVSALWVAMAAVVTAASVYRNNEAVVILSFVGNMCLAPAAGLLHRSARVALVVAAMQVVVYGMWFFVTLAGVSPR